MDRASFDFNRHLTREFIEDDPSFVVLIPSQRVKAPSGGYKEVRGAPRPTQMVKLIPQSTNAEATPTSDGAIRKIQFVMVALHDAVIEEGDMFSWPADSPDKWVITGIHPDNGYEIKADVIAYGLGDRHA